MTTGFVRFACYTLGHTCPNCDWSSMSSRIEYRAEAASLLSRGAATVCSPGRKPGEHVVFEVKPRRGERSDERSECKPDRAQPVRDGICRTYGATLERAEIPGLAPGATFCRRSAAS